MSEGTMSEAMRGLVDRARSDSEFFRQLLSNPGEAAKDFKLSDVELAAITTRSPDRLVALANAGVELEAGCGSATVTCSVTCEVSCKVTFTSVAEG